MGKIEDLGISIGGSAGVTSDLIQGEIQTNDQC